VNPETSLVSVVLPAFNRGHCIAAAIQSVLGQTYHDWELIVIDDGSSDDTGQVVSAFNDPRIKLVRHERNLGASAARNTGIRISNGKLIAFLDSDDTWTASKLEAQVSAMIAAPVGYEVSCTGFFLHLLDHGISRTVHPLEPESWSDSIAVGCELSPGSTQLTRREAFDRVGLLDESLARFEDWDWLFRYTRASPILVLGEPLAHINNHRGRHGDVVQRSVEQFFAKHSSHYSVLHPSLRKKAVSDAWLQVVANYSFEGRFFSALLPLWKSVQQRPAVSLLRALRGAFYVARGRLLRLVKARLRQSGTRQTTDFT